MSASNGKTYGYACFDRVPDFKLQKWEFPLQPLEKDMVEIKVSHCGVCHSDVHVCDSSWGKGQAPLVPGHEIIGVVTQVGEAVKGLKIGQRVGVGPQSGSCGECVYCKSESQTMCPKLRQTYGTPVTTDGYEGTTQGGYALYHRTTEAYAFPIPEHCDSATTAPLLCAGVTTFTPLKRFKVGPGTRVGIAGIGGLGHCGIQIAKAMGAEVVAISSTNSKEAEARKLGASEFVATNDLQDEKKKAEFFESFKPCDIILHTIAADVDVNLYLSLLRKRGTMVFLAAPPANFSISPWILLGHELNVTGSYSGSPQDFRDMFELMSKHDIKAMVEIMPLEKAYEAMQKVVRNEPRYRMVLEMPKDQ